MSVKRKKSSDRGVAGAVLKIVTTVENTQTIGGANHCFKKQFLATNREIFTNCGMLKFPTSVLFRQTKSFQ